MPRDDDSYAPSNDGTESTGTSRFENYGQGVTAHEARHDQDRDDAVEIGDEDDDNDIEEHATSAQRTVQTLSQLGVDVNQRFPKKSAHVRCEKPSDFFLKLKVGAVLKGRTVTHFCPICYQKGVKKGALYSKSNLSKHRAHHEKHNEKITISYVKELEGVVYDFTGLVKKAAELDIGTVMKKGSSLARTALDPESALLRATSEFICAHGLSLDVCESPAFDNLVRAAQSLPSAASRVVGRIAIRKDILTIRQLHFVALVRNLERAEAVTIGSDAWNWGKRRKILGGFIRFVIPYEDGLRQIQSPFLFAQLKGVSRDADAESSLDSADADGESSSDDDNVHELPFQTLESAEDIYHYMKEKLTSLCVNTSKIIHSCGDSAPNALKGANLLLQESELRDTLFENFGASYETVMGCTAHMAGNCLKYALGVATPSNPENSNIPVGSGLNLRKFIAKIRDATAKSSEPVHWALLTAIAQTQGYMKCLVTVNVDMKVRWMSTFNMLEKFNRLYPVIRELYKANKDSPDAGWMHFKKSERKLAVEIVEVLKPVAAMTTFLDTTTKPIVGLILPLIVMSLNHYGMDIRQGIMSRDESVQFDDAFHLEFELEVAVDLVFEPATITRAYADFEAETQDLVDVIREHLYYRFVTRRANCNLIELVATYIDPLANPLFQLACGPDYERHKAAVWVILRRLLEKARKNDVHECAPEPMAPPPPKISKRTVSFPGRGTGAAGSAEAVGEALTREVTEFENFAAAYVGGTAMDLAMFLTEAEKHNPLDFWTRARRLKFPTIYAANLIFLSATNTSIFQESLFSSAGDTLTSRRFRLADSPDTLEAVTIMRYVLNRKLKDEGGKDKAAKAKILPVSKPGVLFTASASSAASSSPLATSEVSSIDLTSA